MAVTAIDKYFCCFIFVYLVSALLVQFFTKNRRKTQVQLRPPPSPPAIPIIGHLPLLLSRTDPLHKTLKTFAFRYAPFMRISIGTSKFLLVSNAAIARQILETHDPNFDSTRAYSRYYGMLYHPDWSFLIKICVTELIPAPQIRRFADRRKQEMLKLLEVLMKCSKGSETCELGEELVKLTNNILCELTMSIESGSNESKQIRELVNGINAQLGAMSIFREVLGPLRKLDMFGYGKRLKALLLEFDMLVEEVMVKHEVDRRHASHERLGREQDLMDMLLDIHEGQDAEVKLTRNNIKRILLEIFMAGSGTTSVALKWALAEIINHPNVLNKLREEVIRVVGLHRLVEDSDVPELPYLQAVVKESLRLHPPMPLILRNCKQDCKINGYDVIAKSRIIINAYAIMRDPVSWKYPTEFMPERFLDSSAGNQHEVDMKGQNLHHLPFGAGSRSCPGTNLALNVMHMVIGELVHCFDFEVKGGRMMIDMEEASSGVTADMAHPLVCYPIIKLLNTSEITTLSK